jgi:hypothetical protein
MPISLTEARALYDSGAPVAHVAAALGLKADAFRKLRQQYGWPLRPSPITRRANETAPAPRPKRKRTPASATPRAETADPSSPDAEPPPQNGDGEAAQVNLSGFRRQVESAALGELAKVQKTLASGKTEDVERNARLLASLVKSLAELRRLEALDPLSGAHVSGAEGQDDERPPRDLETLRDELARALERMSGEPGGQGAGP